MIRGITFDKQLMKSKDHAHEVNYYYQGDLGVTKGCIPSVDANNDIVVTEGYFIVKGRLVNIEGSETIDVPTVPSGTLYSVLVFEIDLTKVNTTTAFNQGSFKILSNASAYPTPTTEDLDNGGTLHQFEFARFENTVGGLVNFDDTRVVLNLSQYARLTDLQSLVIGNIIGLQTALDGKMAYVKNNLTAIIDPVSTDGSNLEYSVGSVWINTVTDIPFICVDATPNLAIWKSYALDSSTLSKILATASWVADGAYWKYAIPITEAEAGLITTDTKIELIPLERSNFGTSALFKTYLDLIQNANIQGESITATVSGTGYVNIISMGTKPTSDVTITVIVRGD